MLAPLDVESSDIRVKQASRKRATIHLDPGVAYTNPTRKRGEICKCSMVHEEVSVQGRWRPRPRGLCVVFRSA
jgi:hypothetical protein